MTCLALGALPTLTRRLREFLLMALMTVAGASTWASPGAHGPNGEHLDGPAQGATASSRGAPRMEAKSEAFELVAVLRADELSMLINRFETSEPVLDAQVEVESGNLKAVAKFHSDLGDYAVDDVAFLKALQTPGEHALVITVLAGNDTDLLDGSLRTTGDAMANAADTAGHGHGHAQGADPGHGIPFKAWIAGSVLALLGLILWLLRSRSSRQSTGAAR
jgi:hypothetical protein